LCLSAVQLLPSLEYRERYNKDINVKLSDSQGLWEIFQDFISPEPFRPGAYSKILRPEEFYAYTGWWPLIGILGLPLAWKRGDKRNIILALSLILFTLVWIDVRDMPWNNLFKTLPVLYQFRYPSRMVVVGCMALITAGGLGLDALRRLSQNLWQNGQRLASGLLTLGLGVFVLWSPINLANTCQPLLSPKAPVVVHNQVATWLKQYDPGQYYVQAPNGWDQALIENQLRYVNGGYGLHYLPDFKNQISERKIELVPKYEIMLSDSPAPDNAHLIKTFENINIYRMTDSLPFAFSASTDTLSTPADAPLNLAEVREESFQSKGTDKIEGYISSDSARKLIVLSTYTPNWQLNIDGSPTKIYSAYGYMAADVNPGRHHYEFVYRPVWFSVGLVISLSTLLMMLATLIMRNKPVNANPTV